MGLLCSGLHSKVIFLMSVLCSESKRSVLTDNIMWSYICGSHDVMRRSLSELLMYLVHNASQAKRIY